MALDYVKPTAVKDCPTVGCLYQAREWKKRTWKGVKALRSQLREARISNRGFLRLELLKVESQWNEAQIFERQCLRTIEEFANRQGLTTIKPKA